MESTPSYGRLTLSDNTKEILSKFGDLTVENPSLLILKEALIQDMRERPEESEFQQYEEQIMSYPEDSMLLLLDSDKTHNEEYFLCLDLAAAETILNQLGETTDLESEPEIDEILEISEEIEEDIEEQVESERDMDTRPKIKITVYPNEKSERRLPEFLHKMPSEHKELFLEILPEGEYYDSEGEEEKEILEPIFRKTVDRGFQESVDFSIAFSQTARPKMSNACAQTEIKLFSDIEKDDIWKTEDMLEFVQSVENRLVDVLVENAAGGLEKPWSLLRSRESDVAAGRDAPLTVNRSFSCVGEGETRRITCLEWHPLHNDVFVVSTIHNCTYEEHVNRLTRHLLRPCLLYIWSFNDHLLSRLLLESFADVFNIKFNPTMPHLVVGGCASGQIVLFDLTFVSQDLQKSIGYDWTRHTTRYDISALGDDTAPCKSPVIRYCASSSIDHSHMLGTHYLEWIPGGIEILPKGEVQAINSMDSFQIVTCGFDGTLRFWDLRYKEEGLVTSKPPADESLYQSLDLIWRPFHVVEIPPPEGQKCLCLTTFSLKLTLQKTADLITDGNLDENQKKQIPTSFIAGTEDGKIVQCDFQLIKDEAGKMIVPKPEFFVSTQGSPVHSAPVVKISHSPFFDDIFCSLGARTMAIWKADLFKGPLFLDISKIANITAGHWSPTRPAVYTLGLYNGSLRIWDFLQSSRSPLLLQSVASAAITSITTRWISENEQVLAVGDGDGFVHILNLPPYLWKPVDKELQNVLRACKFISKSLPLCEEKTKPPTLNILSTKIILALFREFLDREAKRVAMLLKEQAIIDARKAAEAKKLEEERKKKKEKIPEPEKEPKEEKSPEEKEREVFDEDYTEFLALENNCLIELGYLVPKVEEEIVNDDEH